MKINLNKFYNWAYSDLVTNIQRGVLAEYLVASAIGVDKESRLEWEPYDLTSKAGTKIEVKSSAYVQQWNLENNVISTITFDIAPKKRLLKNNDYSKKTQRYADFYVFCLLHHKDKKSINPADTSQWTFYIVSTKVLNMRLGKQKSISLSTLFWLDPIECKYSELKNHIS